LEKSCGVSSNGAALKLYRIVLNPHLLERRGGCCCCKTRDDDDISVFRRADSKSNVKANRTMIARAPDGWLNDRLDGVAPVRSLARLLVDDGSERADKPNRGGGRKGQARSYLRMPRADSVDRLRVSASPTRYQRRSGIGPPVPFRRLADRSFVDVRVASRWPAIRSNARALPCIRLRRPRAR
jgi:hypothetical protein